MNFTINRFRLSCLALLAAALTTATAQADDDEVVPGQVVVRLTPGASIAAFEARYGVNRLDRIPARPVWLIAVPVGDEEEFVDLIEFDPDVQWAEPNFTGRDLDPDPDTQSIFVAGTYSDYLNQPGTGIIRLPQAHNYATGAGVVLAVLDSGIDATHPILEDAIRPGGWNFVDNNADIRDIGDGLDNNANGVIDEMVGHGTIVAGILRRVAPGAQLLPIKVLDSDGVTTTFTLVKGIAHAVTEGADVINISMGTTADTIVLTEAISLAGADGLLVVASAGNEDTASPVRFPSGYSHLGVLAVASTDNSDRRSVFSNFGQHISLTAPGNLLTSTVPGGGFGRASGTSFAAPLVAGGAALVIERYGLTVPAAARGPLVWSVRPITRLNSGYEGLLGSGRLDLLRAMLRFTPNAARPPEGAIAPATLSEP